VTHNKWQETEAMPVEPAKLKPTANRG
jgi:hypothetical protein